MTDTNERARLAGAALNNPLLDEAFAVLREGYIQAAMGCKPDDNENRWRYLAAAKNIDAQKRHLNHVLQYGKIEQSTIRPDIEDPSVWKRVTRGLWSDNVETEKAIA